MINSRIYKFYRVAVGDYLEVLLLNAYEHNYKFIIWWAYRDFDKLWEIFPAEYKDIEKLWRDTGLLDENGKESLAVIS